MAHCWIRDHSEYDDRHEEEEEVVQDKQGSEGEEQVCADLSSLSLSQAEDILPDQLSGHKTMRGLDIKNVCVPVHSQTFLMV